MKFEARNPKSENFQKGVTLVELVVALALFMAVIGVTVSIFLSVVSQQRAILQQQAVLNQASYLTDYLGRTIRMSLKDTAGNCLTDESGPHPGAIYLLTRQENGFYQGLKLLANNGVCHEIFLDEDGALKETKGGQEPQNILSDAFVIPYARFIINGDKELGQATGVDGLQPRVTFMINILTNVNGTPKNTFIQTTVSQINLNL